MNAGSASVSLIFVLDFRVQWQRRHVQGRAVAGQLAYARREVKIVRERNVTTLS